MQTPHETKPLSTSFDKVDGYIRKHDRVKYVATGFEATTT